MPLCGKSLDMRYLAESGHEVIGVEMSEIAIESFFREGDDTFERESSSCGTSFRSGRITIHCGDVFDLAAAELSGVHSVFDRAALVALPWETRAAYARHLLGLLPPGGCIFLITLEYDQDLVAGPPFSVLEDHVWELFDTGCSIERVDARPTDDLPPRFVSAGVVEAIEAVYFITRAG